MTSTAWPASPRLAEHRDIWARKPSLGHIYGVWFDAILDGLPKAARVLEVGAGPGFFAAHARRARPDLRWIASDLLPVPWNDLAGDALRLPVRDGCFDAVVGLDFIHHLARPEQFFRESARVLAPGGRLVAVEPWITPFSYPVYRFIHHELCRMDVDPWTPFGAAKDAFDGDSALVRALVRRTSAESWRALGLRPPAQRPLNGFAYLLSLGFKPPSLLPAWALPMMLGLDATLQRGAAWLGLRVWLAWEKA
jgi:SAM-dependent methyltransferase